MSLNAESKSPIIQLAQEKAHLKDTENLAAFVHIQAAMIAQDIHPGRGVVWDIRPTWTYIQSHFPSGDIPSGA